MLLKSPADTTNGNFIGHRALDACNAAIIGRWVTGVYGAQPLVSNSRVLVCSNACLPDERHITGPRSGTAIVDTNRVCAGHLDVH